MSHFGPHGLARPLLLRRGRRDPIVLDVDGTVCFDGGTIAEEIALALDELADRGHPIVFASARPVRDLAPVLAERFPDAGRIGANGALWADQDDVATLTRFSADDRAILEAEFAAFDARYLVDGPWDFAYTGPEDHPLRSRVNRLGQAQKLRLDDLELIVKALALSSRNQDALADRLDAAGLTVHRHHGEDLVDVSPGASDKWSALDILGVPEGGYIAFGNDANDVTLLAHAALGVRVGHHSALDEVADRTVAADASAVAAQLRALARD